MNNIQFEIEDIKRELREKDNFLLTLEKRSANLESFYNYQNDKLDEIKKQIDEITRIVRVIENKFSEHTGAENMKNKFFNRFYGIAGTIIAAISVIFGSDYLMKKFFKS